MPRKKRQQTDIATLDGNIDVVPSYERCKTADILAILDYAKAGYTQVQIAQLTGVAQSTVSKHLADARRHHEQVRQLVASDPEDAIDAWKLAEKVAASRGDHRPAKERLELAHSALRPQTAQQGGGITINIGMPGKPLERPVIDVQAVGTQRLSPLQLSDTGEGEQNP